MTFIFLSFLLWGMLSGPAPLNMHTPGTYSGEQGKVHFISVAPMETIEASNKQLKGVLVPNTRNFAFVVPVVGFEGFNSPLQKEHFNENYLQTKLYPKASYEGKIIEDIDFSKPGKHAVRAKGKFNIHGVSQEVIVKGNLTVTDKNIRIQAVFNLVLNDFNIPIPKVVNLKIAESVEVDVDITMQKQ